MKSAAWWAPTHLWSSESNKTPVIWQGSRIRCNTSRDLQSRRSSSCRETELFHIMWRKEAIPQEFKDATIIHLFKRKGNPQPVTIIEASLYCQLLGRSLLGSYWTDWMNTSNGQGFYQKASVDSGKTEEQWTWPLQHDSFKKNARNRMWLLHDLCRPHQSIWHKQSWGTLENYGKVWLSCQIHSNGAAIPWWYACKGPKWWRVFWSISCDKWS